MCSSKLIRTFSFLILAYVIIGCKSESADSLFASGNEAAAREFFTNELSAVIEAKCISCHDNYHSSGTSRYDTYEKTVAAIAQIDSRIHASDNTIMPTADAEALTPDELLLFEEFIDILNSESSVVEDEDNPFSISWTAYKYLDRFSAGREDAGVGGKFNEFEYSLNTNYTDPIEVLDGATVTINALSVNVANNEPTRTGNVLEFFEAFTPDIIGTVTNYSETDATIEFEMNGETSEVDFTVEISEDEEENEIITLIGAIPDMSVFNWGAGYAVLEEACGDYHEGMLWADVDLQAVINVSAIELLRDRESLPVDVTWTAYKYEDPSRDGAGVSGTFNRFEYFLNENYTDLVDVLEGATIEILTSSVNVSNNEPVRTGNVGLFFAAFTPDIIGQVISYTNTTADVRFTMNGISQTVTLAIELDEDQNTVTLSGRILDLGDYEWEAGKAAIDAVCNVLHEGKLWEYVDVSVTIKANEL